MQLLRKISARTVFGGKSAVLETVFKDKTKPQPLYRVVGICNGTRHGQTIEGEDGTQRPAKQAPSPTDKMRDWQALLGNFEATNLQTGEVFRSGVCFLPSYVADIVAGQLIGDTQSVKFAFDVYAVFDENSITSYQYQAMPLMAVSEDDPLKQLSGSLQPPASLPNPARAAVAPAKAKA